MRSAIDGIAAEMVPEKCMGMVWYDKNDGNGLKPYLVKQAQISAASSGDNTIVAANATKQIVVVGWDIWGAGTVTARWCDDAGTGTPLTGAVALLAQSRWNSPVSNDSPLTPGTLNKILNLSLGGAVAVAGSVWYILV